MNTKHFYTAVILLAFLAIGIRPILATTVIGPDLNPPELPSIGTWDGETRTFTLTQDVEGGLEIVNGVMTLDGKGYTLDRKNTVDTVGVHVFKLRDVNIVNLNITGFDYGITLYGEYYNPSDPTKQESYIVENCNIYNNAEVGIDISEPDDTTIRNNTINNNNVGIALAVGTFYNEIYYNTISNNGIVGLNILGSSTNVIYNNNFIDNGTQAYNGGSSNSFDLDDPAIGGEGGNYWSNYTGTDDDGDGIGDTPHSLNFGQDDYPWMVKNGWTDPAVLIGQLVSTVESMNLQQGIDNSLDAKLDAASNALDDVNQNNDTAAINSLNAFINAVEAQRGAKITDAQADELIAQAQAIITKLSAR